MSEAAEEEAANKDVNDGDEEERKERTLENRAAAHVPGADGRHVNLRVHDHHADDQ